MSKNNFDPYFGLPYSDPRFQQPTIQAPPMFGVKKKKRNEREKLFLKKALKAFKIVKLIEESDMSCNHVDDNGAIQLSEPDEKGYRRCNVCGKRFKLIEPDSKDDLCSIIESAKVYGDPKVFGRLKSMLK